MGGMPDEEMDLFQHNPVYADAAFPGLQTHMKLISEGRINKAMIPCSLRTRRYLL